MTNLARIERADLREMWPNEASDFTPWLVENIGDLGAALDMDLEVERQEASVGGYSLDILARESGSGRPVVIENQLGVTDHGHLGQLLTYAAGFEANVIVWIARQFREEHRAVLDLLNSRTGDDSEFFGVEVELWKIDNSRPAINFKLVATPNEWRKQGIARKADRGASERGERYRAFWQALLDTMRDEHRFTNAKKVQPLAWCSFPAGYGQRVIYQARFRPADKARVELRIDSGDREWNIHLLNQLSEHKEGIESELGEALEWEPLEQHRRCRIAVDRGGSIDDAPEPLEEIREWMVDRLLKFKSVFGPRLSDMVD